MGNERLSEHWLEKKFELIDVLAIAFLVAIISICLSELVGEGIGMNRMKHWQDDWYAAHPVVKEVPPPIDDAKLVFWMGSNGEVCREDAHFPEQHGQTCLRLEKPHEGICEGWAGIWWGDRPCPVAPKPQKGSKRPHETQLICPPNCVCSFGDAGRTICPQPIPEKEPKFKWVNPSSVPEQGPTGAIWDPTKLHFYKDSADYICTGWMRSDALNVEAQPTQVGTGHNWWTTDWVVELEPCERRIYRFSAQTGKISCDAAPQPAEKP